MPPKNSSSAAVLSLIAVIALIISPLAVASTSGGLSKVVPTVQLTATQEYLNYVHNFVGPLGNCTYVEKPMFPVLIQNSQIPIGENWTIICPLTAGHNYHIYFYGSYINMSSVAKTDYNVFVYDPQGKLESSHTQSAGLPEHLGTNVTVPLFTPLFTGNYTFVINNDPVDSKSAQEATFMIIESLQTDQWYSTYIDGTNDNVTNFYTNWAYEFETNASTVALYIKVPGTLDMYEARLYLMNNAQSPTLDNFPLPWEPGLYGNLTGSVGGYNFEPNSYRGVAYASCEYMGQPMFLNYTSPNKGANLYQVVLMGQIGAGNVTFMLKSNFENANLVPSILPGRVYPNNATQIAYMSTNNTLASAQLSYTTNNWNSTRTVSMSVSNRTCSGTIPGQSLGAFVQYKVNATDVLENTLLASGNYTVKDPAALNITAAKEKIMLGQSLKITGTITPYVNDSEVEIQFASVNAVKDVSCIVKNDGTFSTDWKPSATGVWFVTAMSNETQLAYDGISQKLTITVTPAPLYIRYSLYIIIAFVAFVAVCAVVYFLRARQS
jgi:hypothetical protein